MNKLLRGLVLLGAVGLVLGVIALLAARSGSRAELQRYKAELRAKGEKLSYSELDAVRRPAGEDTHAVITIATVSLRNYGLNPGLLELRSYVGPGAALVNWRQAKPVWQKSSAAGGGG